MAVGVCGNLMQYQAHVTRESPIQNCSNRNRLSSTHCTMGFVANAIQNLRE